MFLTIVNYVSHVAPFMLAAWNAGYNFFFDSVAANQYLTAWMENFDKKHG